MTAIVVVMTFAPIVSAGAYTIENDIIGNGYPAGRTQSNNFIILHEAGNPNNVGPNSLDNEVSFMKRTWNTTAFVSHFVGSGGRVKQLANPGAYQYGAGTYANSRSYAQIELSRTNNKATFEKDYKTYVNLARNLAKQAGLPLTLDSAGNGIKSHKWISDNFWGDHQDPYGYLAQHGISKADLAQDLRTGLDSSDDADAEPETPATGSTAPEPDPDKRSGFHAEKATFTNGDTAIRVRSGVPGLDAPRAGMLPAGAKINYEGWVAKDGYTWVRYTGNSGNTLYLPVRHNGTPYGTFDNGKQASQPSANKIAEDGQWGSSTTRRLQQYLGTSQDGVISGQIRTSANANVYSAQWGNSGSNVIRALQAKLGLPQDGNLGPATVRALQAHLGTTQDGQISPRSNVVKAMQHALNNGTF